MSDPIREASGMILRLAESTQRAPMVCPRVILGGAEAVQLLGGGPDDEGFTVQRHGVRWIAHHDDCDDPCKDSGMLLPALQEIAALLAPMGSAPIVHLSVPGPTEIVVGGVGFSGVAQTAAPPRAKIRVHEPLLARTRDLDPETLVLRVPPDMGTLSAHITRTEEGQALIFWAGLSPDQNSLACGVLGCFLSLRAAAELGDTRVLLGEGGVWMVGEIEGER